MFGSLSFSTCAFKQVDHSSQSQFLHKDTCGLCNCLFTMLVVNFTITCKTIVNRNILHGYMLVTSIRHLHMGNTEIQTGKPIVT